MNDSGFISGLGSRSDLIHASADAEQRGLTPEELALARAAGAGTSVEQVLSRSGLPEAKAIATLLGLRLRGIIGPGARRAPGSAPAAARPAPPPSSPTPPPTPTPGSGGIQLDEERRREILEVEARCERDDYFALLGVPPGTPAAEVKKAYYELTKRFHPDRFFGKSLGDLKERIDKIFRKMTEAQAVLTDPVRRKAYLDAHPHLAPKPAPAAPPASPIDQQKANERRSRLARHPYLAKHTKLLELTSRGKQALEKKEYARAYTDLQLAAQLDPQNKELAAMVQQAKRGGDRVRAAAELKDGEQAEKMSDWAAAIAKYRTAASLDPENAPCADRLARLLLHLSGEAELKEAHTHARRAAELAPDVPEYHLTFAKCLMRAGLEKNAIREFEAVLKLKPDESYAKEQLRKLKWKL